MSITIPLGATPALGSPDPIQLPCGIKIPVPFLPSIPLALTIPTPKFPPTLGTKRGPRKTRTEQMVKKMNKLRSLCTNAVPAVRP